MKLVPSLLVLIAVTAQTGYAQVLRGRVTDSQSGTPLPGARVSIRAAGDTVIAVVYTEDDGTFVLRTRRPGSYLVDVVRLGFGPAHHGPVELAAGQTVGLDVPLAQIPFQLDSVTVMADANSAMLQRVGWYVRQRSDFGKFLTRQDIDKHHVRRITDLLTTVPGVTLVTDPRSPGHVRVRMRGSQLAVGSLCEPRVFVDGLIVIRGGSKPFARPSGITVSTEAEDPFDDPRTPEPSLDDIAETTDIEAMEVYRSASQVPAEFGGTGVFTRCGVVVIWTRRGR